MRFYVLTFLHLSEIHRTHWRLFHGDILKMLINIYRVDFELLQRKILPKNKRNKFKSDIYIIVSESNTCALNFCRYKYGIKQEILDQECFEFYEMETFKHGLIDFINLCREVCQSLILQINILLCVF